MVNDLEAADAYLKISSFPYFYEIVPQLIAEDHLDFPNFQKVLLVQQHHLVGSHLVRKVVQLNVERLVVGNFEVVLGVDIEKLEVVEVDNTFVGLDSLHVEQLIAEYQVTLVLTLVALSSQDRRLAIEIQEIRDHHPFRVLSARP